MSAGEVSDFDGDYVYYHNVSTEKFRRVYPTPPATDLDLSARNLPIKLPKVTSASSGISLIREHLPRLTRALNHHYQREKLPEEPGKNTWKFVSPVTGYVLHKVLCLVAHVEKGKQNLPPQAIEDLEAAHDIVLRAAKFSDRINDKI